MKMTWMGVVCALAMALGAGCMAKDINDVASQESAVESAPAPTPEDETPAPEPSENEMRAIAVYCAQSCVRTAGTCYDRCANTTNHNADESACDDVCHAQMGDCQNMCARVFGQPGLVAEVPDEVPAPNADEDNFIARRVCLFYCSEDNINALALCHTLRLSGLSHEEEVQCQQDANRDRVDCEDDCDLIPVPSCFPRTCSNIGGIP